MEWNGRVAGHQRCLTMTTWHVMFCVCNIYVLVVPCGVWGDSWLLLLSSLLNVCTVSWKRRNGFFFF